MDAEAIRDLIRQKLHDGRLPRGSAPRAFGRPGNWQKCAACEKTMHKALPMMEVYPLTNEKVVRFHGDCYTLWNEERRVLASLPPPRSLRFPERLPRGPLRRVPRRALPCGARRARRRLLNSGRGEGLSRAHTVRRRIAW
jgi:hypothetical protein